MKTTDRLRQLLEGSGHVVDIAIDPFGTVPGLVSFHRHGQPSKKAIVKVFERLVRLDDELVARLARQIREMECQKDETEPSTD